jgi:ribosomal protein S27AE
MLRSKKCFKCGKEKGLREFYKHPQMKDGHLNKCKVCAKADSTKHRLENLESVRAYDRDRAKHEHRVRARAEITATWRRADKRRGAAHGAVARAIRSGRLKRKPCERCGDTTSYAHHESYDKKLEINWLCQPCHKERHKEMAIAGLEP